MHCVYYSGETIPGAHASCLELMFIISWLGDIYKNHLKSILKVDCDKKNYMQLRNAESGRDSLPQRRTPNW